jgi:hypothetical protein
MTAILHEIEPGYPPGGKGSAFEYVFQLYLLLGRKNQANAEEKSPQQVSKDAHMLLIFG